MENIQHLLLYPFSDLEQDGFSKNPFFHGIVAEVPEQLRTKDGELEPVEIKSCRNQCVQETVRIIRGALPTALNNLNSLLFGLGCEVETLLKYRSSLSFNATLTKSVLAAGT